MTQEVYVPLPRVRPEIPFYEVTGEEEDRRIAGHAIEPKGRRSGRLITGTTMRDHRALKRTRGKSCRPLRPDSKVETALVELSDASADEQAL